MKFTANLFFVAIVLVVGLVHCNEDEVDDSDNEVFDGQGKIFNVYQKLRSVPPKDTMDDMPLSSDDMVAAAKLPKFPVLADSQRDPEVQERTLKAELANIEREYDEMSFARNDKRLNPEESLDVDDKASAKSTRSRNSKFLGFPNEEKSN